MILLKMYFCYNNDFKFIVPYNPKRNPYFFEYDRFDLCKYCVNQHTMISKQLHFDCYDAFRLKDLICWRIIQPFDSYHNRWYDDSQPREEYKNKVDYFSELIIQKYYKDNDSKRIRHDVESWYIPKFLWKI